MDPYQHQRRAVLGRLATLAVLGTLAIMAAPAGAQAFYKAIWGPVYRDGVYELPLYHQLGSSIYEFELPWATVAPTRPARPTDPDDPAYHWPLEVSQALAGARQFHMRVLLQITGAPPWANGGRNADWAPRNPRDFANFATAAARRYRSVHLWMVWGEPTRAPNFEPITPVAPFAKLSRAVRRAPHLYARILDAAYGALKQVSRSNLVIGGCSYTTGAIDTLQWIENLRLPDGRPPRMDMYAQNPFSYQQPNFSAAPSPFDEVQFSDLPRLAHWLDHYLRPGLPLFLSEFTIPTQQDEEFNFYVDPVVAAEWITDALRLSRRWHRIYALGWINVYDNPPYSYSGLITAAGVPKPGFKAWEDG